MELTKDVKTKWLKQNLNKSVGYRNYETAFPISILGRIVPKHRDSPASTISVSEGKSGSLLFF